MDILNIIDKKRKKEKLSKEELNYAFMGYLNNEIKDYQMSSLLMAITINGMDFQETLDLTDIFLHSGIVLDEKCINGVSVDKHSTGGIGDKTSLIIGPILASLGLKMGKLSGRGLGYTGGTIDKLESIPGFKTQLTKEEFINNVNKIGFVECSQTDDFVPLDNVIYSLRSVTGTVSSLPLIASSIMSKKLAIGAKYILIDIKIGEGALIRTKEDGQKLASIMINIGNAYNKCVIPVLTDMNTPLGDKIGNSLEVQEAIEILRGKKSDLQELCVNLAAILYSKAYNLDLDDATKLVKENIENGKAYKKFLDFVNAQGGNINALKVSDKIVEIRSEKEGTIKSISALKIGEIVLNLGGGRHYKDEKINHKVGVELIRRKGDFVTYDDVLCKLYVDDDKDYNKCVQDAFEIVK
jgi:pyrimidine-nucleoside phosphorylase